MNGKKAVTIGLLTIATLGLVACAINFSKNKAKQTNADYYISNYEDTTHYTFSGESIKTSNGILYGDQWYPEFNYTITSNGDEKTITITPTKIKTDTTWQNVSNVTNNIYTYTTQYEFKTIEITPQTPSLFFDETQTPPEIVTQTYNIDITYTTNATRSGTLTTKYNIPNVLGYPYIDMPAQIKTIIDIQANITLLNNVATQEHTDGYQEGWNDNTTLSNPIDIRGLMLNILTMPFTFIRQAFNVTMWEGTPYQFNVSNFILSLIAIATILFIIRLFTSGFSVIGNYQASKENRELTRSQTRLNQAKENKIKKETK